MPASRTRLCHVLALSALVSLTLFTVACHRVETAGPLQTEHKYVPLGGARQVDVHVRMGMGHLTITPGKQALLDATFTYNMPNWQPLVKYTTSGDQGRLDISQPTTSIQGLPANGRYDWDIKLLKGVPLNLNVELGVSESTLDVRGLDVDTLALHSGVGKSVIDLRGNWKRDLKATVVGGVGELTVRLPTQTGVRVEAKAGIGSINAPTLHPEGSYWVNDLTGKTPVTLNLQVTGGVGAVNLESGP